MAMSKTVRNLLIFAVIVIVLIGLGVGAYLLFRKKAPPAIIPIYPNPQPLTNLRTTLTTNETLNQDDKLWDATGTFYLTAQSQDGNLVLYDYRGPPHYYWSCCPSGWGGTKPFSLINQPDGNVVLYDVSHSSSKVGFQTVTANLSNTTFPYTLSIKTYSNSQGQLLPQLQLVDNGGKILWKSPGP